MVGAEIGRHILQPLGDCEIAGLERCNDRARRLVARYGGIVEGVVRTAFDDGLVLLVAGAGARRVGLRDDQLGGEVGDLLVADQLAVAVGGQAMLGPEFLDRERRRLRALAKLGQPALQPDRRALGGVEAGIELVGEIGVGIGLGDGGGERRIGRLVTDGEHIGAAVALRQHLALQLQHGIVVARRLHHAPGVSPHRRFPCRESGRRNLSGNSRSRRARSRCP